MVEDEQDDVTFDSRVPAASPTYSADHPLRAGLIGRSDLALGAIALGPERSAEAWIDRVRGGPR